MHGSRIASRPELTPDMSELLQHWSTLVPSAAKGEADSAVRRRAMDLALAADLPHGRVEAWKYTSLRALARRTPALLSPVTVDATLLAGIPTPRIVFVNGHLDAQATAVDNIAGLHIEPRAVAQVFEFDGPAHALNQVNAALDMGGVDIRVTGMIDSPLHLVWISDSTQSEGSQHSLHRIVLSADSRLNLVESVRSNGAHLHIGTARMEINLGEQSELHHARVQRDDEGASWFLRTEVTLQARSTYRRVDVELGSALSRHELVMHINGDGARVFSNGILFGDGKRHLDTRLAITHSAQHTGCELNWRGLGTGRSRIAFYGGITIDAGADHTEAALSNRNLLLSEQAEIDTQPVLVIHADEVQAAHGATVGQLDANSLFYLRSRGIDDHTARTLLVAAFVHELLNLIEDEPTRTAFATLLDGALDRVEFV